MITAGPGQAGRNKSLDQEQHEPPDPKPRQSLETIGPHYVSIALTANAWTRKRALAIGVFEVPMPDTGDTAILCKKQLTHRSFDLQAGALAKVPQPAQPIADDRFIVVGVSWLSRCWRFVAGN